MKDKDFDDIGKRLYDEEADPPKSGWSRVHDSLHAPKPARHIQWFRKHGWKPLLLLIPLSAVLLYDMVSPTSARSVAKTGQSSVAQIINEGETQNVSGDTAESSSVSGELETPESTQSSEVASLSTESIASKKTEGTSTVFESGDGKGKSNLGMRGNTIPRTAAASDPVDGRHSAQTKATDGENTIVISTEKVRAVVGDDNGLRQTDSSSSAENKPEDAMASDHEPSVLNKHIAMVDDVALIPTDSIIKRIESDADTLNEQQTEKDEDESPLRSRGWRVTASFMPHFSSEKIAPDDNDEILITEIKSVSSNKRVGYGFALGVGKAITPSFYIDAQLMFSRMQQDIGFSYATGKIDTLIAEERADRTYSVRPVYEVINREVSTVYNHGGIRIGATYYLMETPRSRFNIIASIGTDFSFGGSTREKVMGTWVSKSSDNTTALNYSVMAGAGYNIRLSHGWEIMISPMTTRFLKKIKSEGMPYNLSQRSVGLNIMLSKFF